MTTQKINKISSYIIKKSGLLKNNQIWIYFWRTINVISLFLVGTGIYYGIKNLNFNGMNVRFEFLLIAFIIYILTLTMHLRGWHILSSSILGQKDFFNNIEAVARSNFVKYLPTIAWYIANRAHYYHLQGVPKSQVVTASLYELGFMVSGCVLFLNFSWLLGVNIWLSILFVILIALIFVRLITRRVAIRGIQLSNLVKSFLWYAATWPISGFFFWAIVSAYTPMSLLFSFQELFNIWLLSSITSYAISITIGLFGFAREVTLVVLLNQLIPLPISIIISVSVKLMLTISEIICSIILLSLFYFIRVRSSHE